MPIYTVSQRYYFREIGYTREAGQTIELSKEDAEKHNKSHPGLLSVPRVTTQAAAPSVRVVAKEEGEKVVKKTKKRVVAHKKKG